MNEVADLRTKVRWIERRIAAAKVTMATDSRDWSLSPRDAWLYGIICGWDEASIAELREKFGWDEATVAHLRTLMPSKDSDESA